jgi:hypothetical protein
LRNVNSADISQQCRVLTCVPAQRRVAGKRAALMELKLDEPTKFAAVPMPAAGGERHD